MEIACLPANEVQRLEAVRRSGLLDAPRDALFDRVCALASRMLGMPFAFVTLIEHDVQWFKSTVGLEIESVPRSLAFCSHALLNDGLMIVPDMRSDTRFNDHPFVAAPPGVRFYAGAPLKTADGYKFGTLCVMDNTPHADFDAEKQATLSDLSEIITAWIRLRESAGQLDASTGVFTRQRLHDALEAELQSMASGASADAQRLMVAVVDVALPRQMHDLTEIMGYHKTELFIVECINRLSDAVGGSVDLYRIGMFRFGCIMREPAGIDLAQRLDGLMKTLRAPLHSAVGVLIAPSATMGISLLDAHASTSAEEYLRLASVAADDAWESQRTWALYTRHSDASRKRKLRLLVELPEALSLPDRLHLEYQPKIDLRTGRCTGVEALLRWQHIALGVISPMELIDAAEKTALMRPLTDWVLDTALAQCARWRAAGIDLQVAVNLSAHDLTDPNLVDRVASALARYGLAGSALELEFTESVLISNVDAVLPKLAQITQLGVSTAIDDFGTGYCNLSYLQKLNVNCIKLDRDFVKTIDNDKRSQRLTRSIVNLAHDLGYRIVAEGIETRAELCHLRRWGSEQGQGYLFSRPLRAAALINWLAEKPNALPGERRRATRINTG